MQIKFHSFVKTKTTIPLNLSKRNLKVISKYNWGKDYNILPYLKWNWKYQMHGSYKLLKLIHTNLVGSMMLWSIKLHSAKTLLFKRKKMCVVLLKHQYLFLAAHDEELAS